MPARGNLCFGASHRCCWFPQVTEAFPGVADELHALMEASATDVAGVRTRAACSARLLSPYPCLHIPPPFPLSSVPLPAAAACQSLERVIHLCSAGGGRDGKTALSIAVEGGT